MTFNYNYIFICICWVYQVIYPYHNQCSVLKFCFLQISWMLRIFDGVTLSLQVTATICEELSSDSILLIYISASGLSCASAIMFVVCLPRPSHFVTPSEKCAGKTDCSVASHKNVNGKSTDSSKANHAPQASWKRDSSPSQPATDDKLYSSTNPGSYLCLGAQGAGANFCLR